MIVGTQFFFLLDHKENLTLHLLTHLFALSRPKDLSTDRTATMTSCLGTSLFAHTQPVQPLNSFLKHDACQSCVFLSYISFSRGVEQSHGLILLLINTSSRPHGMILCLHYHTKSYSNHNIYSQSQHSFLIWNVQHC